MSSYSYAVRGTDGFVVRGQTAETANGVIAIQQASQVSLNLTPAEVAGYVNDGGNLVIHLVSGETITLENYFSGDERELLLSKDGQLQVVDLGDPINDQYFAQYESVSMTDKWSEYDQLAFLDLERVEPVVAPLAAPLAGLVPGLLGVGGAAAVASTLGGGEGEDTVDGGEGDDGTGDDNGDDDNGGDEEPNDDDTTGGDDGGDGGGDDDDDGDDGGDDDTILPTVDDADVPRIVGGTGDDSVTITGTGEPGSTVTVTIGDETGTGTVGDDGTYEVIFEPGDLPDDGDYDVDVTVEGPDGAVYDLDGPSVDIDTTPPDVSVMDGTVSTGDIVNEDDHTTGHVISGTGEPGAALTVEIDGVTQSTTVQGDGSWSVTFDSSSLSTGEYTTGITITSTDERGNVTTVTDTLEVDTIAPGVDMGIVEGDNIINATEASDGVVLSGTGEPGSSLSILFEGVTQTVTVANDGSWSSAFDASAIGTGTYDSTVSITATDLAGNSHTETFTVHIDTDGLATITSPIAGDDIVNAAEAAAGVTLTGTAEPGSSVAVTVEGVTHTVNAAGDGSWSATFAAGEIPQGTYDTTVTVTATDLAGNVTSTSDSFRVDTEISAAMNPSQLGGDNTANATEVAGGFTLTGTAEPGSSVAVTMEGVTHTVTTAANGTWAATFAGGEIPQGTYNSTVSITATDAAGNSATTTGTVAVDTELSAGINTGQAGGDDIANAAEVAGGLSLTGTADAGSSVVVQIAGASRTVTAAANGTWVANFTAADIPQGEYDTPVTVTATDAAGNTATATSTIHVDTTTSIDVDLSAGVFAAPVNAAQMQGGVVLEGTTEPNSSVVVTVDGVVRSTTSDASGNWFVTYENGSLAEGTYTANATLSVTDAAGNTATANATFAVDTEITNPVVQSVTFSDDDVTSLSLSTENQDYEIHALNQDGSTAELATTEVALGGDESLYVLNPKASDGTHLVIASTDDAGNQSDTLLVLDDNVTNAGTLDHAAAGNFNIEGIELDYASDANLTLTEAQIKELSDTSDTLTIHGGSDDQITVTDATKTNQTVDIEGEAYDVYTVGNDGVTLIVDQDINVII
ncbi:Ig-like domain-containing protein [Shimia sp. MIT910701]|uniref:Ig-like domain-containing protein n=1 Tax=Shimia sp. MIT910701 TaxID=3096987 RepID=UPI0039999DB4